LKEIGYGHQKIIPCTGSCILNNDKKIGVAFLHDYVIAQAALPEEIEIYPGSP
jgi:hypothetical protein